MKIKDCIDKEHGVVIIDTVKLADLTGFHRLHIGRVLHGVVPPTKKFIQSLSRIRIEEILKPRSKLLDVVGDVQPVDRPKTPKRQRRPLPQYLIKLNEENRLKMEEENRLKMEEEIREKELDEFL